MQEKIKGGTDLVELGKENGHDFSAEDVTAAYEELKDSDEGLTEFELEAVSGGLSENDLEKLGWDAHFHKNGQRRGGRP